jgi:hypothetical protein
MARGGFLLSFIIYYYVLVQKRQARQLQLLSKGKLCKSIVMECHIDAFGMGDCYHLDRNELAMQAVLSFPVFFFFFFFFFFFSCGIMDE